MLRGVNETPHEAPPPAAKETSFGEVFRRLGPAGVLGVVAAFAPALGGILLLAHLGEAGSWLRSLDTWGVVVYAAAFALLSGLSLLPTYAQSILGGWAFGFAAGFPGAMAGFFGGSLLGYDVARAAARERAMTLLREHPRWIAVRNALVGGEAGQETTPVGFWKTLGIVTLVRLPPNSPFAITNLVMAAVKVPRIPYALGTLIGMAPRTCAAVYLASLVQDQVATADAIKAQRPGWYIPVAIGVSIAVLAIVGMIAKRALDRVTGLSGAASARVKPGGEDPQS